jgi:hypothetical protein
VLPRRHSQPSHDTTSWDGLVGFNPHSLPRVLRALAHDVVVTEGEDLTLA